MWTHRTVPTILPSSLSAGCRGASSSTISPLEQKVTLTHFSFRSIVRTGGGSAECSEVGDRAGGWGSRGGSRAVRPKALGDFSTPRPILLAALPSGNKTSELPLPSILKWKRDKSGLFWSTQHLDHPLKCTTPFIFRD